MSLNLALTSGISGLQVAQRGLDTVAHNLANVNTPGYTRKIFYPESVVLAGNGTGVQTGGIIRRVDDGLNEDLRLELARLEELETSNEFFERMQDLLGTPAENSSISHRLTSLYEQLEAVALDPDSSSAQLSALRQADTVVSQLNTLSRKLQEFRLDADQEIDTAVNEINDRIAAIDNLNEEISLGYATERDVTDLLDKRDLELQKLSSLIDVTSFERAGGALVIYTAAGSVLLDAEPEVLSHTAASQVAAWDSHGGGDFSAISLDAVDITSEIGGGKLAALIEMRDKTLVNYQAQVDELTQALKETINQVHNRGTSYPNVLNEYNGTRAFVAPGTQTVSLQAPDDVMVTVYNTDGSEKASVSLNTLMQNTNLADDGSGAVVGTGTNYGSGGPWTITQMTAKMQSWLRSAAGAGLTGADVAVGTDGKVAIDLNDNTAGLAFRDQVTSAKGGTAQDATVLFDKNGDGHTDETVEGFANFFGLNDFFIVDRTNDWVMDSAVKAANWTPNVTGTLMFYDSATPPGAAGAPIGSLSVQANWTLSDIATAINQSTTLADSFEAEVVREGEGYRLRIKSRDGNDMILVQGGATPHSLMEQLGMESAAVGVSGQVAVRADLLEDPSKLSRGSVLYNSDINEYYLSGGDNTTANQMAAAFQTGVSFDAAGGLTTGARSFADYAALIINQNASEASIVSGEVTYQTQLADSLSLKQGEISAVNMDEELSQLLVWEQMYNASAKVIATVADMLDTLNSIIR